jgi:hypothetical protein
MTPATRVLPATQIGCGVASAPAPRSESLWRLVPSRIFQPWKHTMRPSLRKDKDYTQGSPISVVTRRPGCTHTHAHHDTRSAAAHLEESGRYQPEPRSRHRQTRAAQRTAQRDERFHGLEIHAVVSPSRLVGDVMHGISESGCAVMYVA